MARRSPMWETRPVSTAHPWTRGIGTRPFRSRSPRSTTIAAILPSRLTIDCLRENEHGTPPEQGYKPKLIFTSDFHELVNGDLIPGPCLLRYDPHRVVPSDEIAGLPDTQRPIKAHLRLPSFRQLMGEGHALSEGVPTRLSTKTQPAREQCWRPSFHSRETPRSSNAGSPTWTIAGK